MGSLQSNIRVQRVSNGLMGGQYWSVEGGQWAHGSSILDCGGCPVSSLQSNIELRRVSGGLTEVQYCGAEGF